jgi:hypothetical protein
MRTFRQRLPKVLFLSLRTSITSGCDLLPPNYPRIPALSWSGTLVSGAGVHRKHLFAA